MKIKKEHYEHIKNELRQIPTNDLEMHWEYLQTDKRIKDINKRFRWDCFASRGLSKYSCNVLYTYLDDTHIDSALKAIIKELSYPSAKRGK